MNQTAGQARRTARMDAEHPFQFQCHPAVPCFTQCCQDVTIALTPYDVVRLKARLGLSSAEFLDRYTVVIPAAGRLIPLVVLQMNPTDKHCPFVSESGCGVYEDRPWPCRMYPLDMNADGTFRVIASPERCQGLHASDTWPIGEWLLAQGVVPYDEMNTLFGEITQPLQAQEPEVDNPQVRKMLFMSLYNLDKFREFVLQSTFLERFEVEPTRVEKIKRNDTELLKFAFDWVKFGLLGQILFRVAKGESGKGCGPKG